MNTIAIEQELGDAAVQLFIDDIHVSPKRSQQVWNHSPGGFNVGYMGSGPAQTALAILLCFTDQKTAVRLHQTFKAEFVSRMSVGKQYDIDVYKWIEEHS